MKELVKPIKEVESSNAEGYCESYSGCHGYSGSCASYLGCGGYSWNDDQDNSDILF